ncbi:T-cell ecto-ADP-ribosyltransferase 2-like isoform X4 [Ornithorhynchus anatinus]|nr:T-cell ecto-ADP-ribosyltransferase 2-like isoform X4 [Ornithorhynchus anatinus]XP_028904781.1 T-cell ecto-ADP-ribosyltransferase 2-like isoform X4 [Ornithorhynchus anatinus]
MTMQYHAFDDQYKGCENDMDSIAPQLLQDEMRNNALLNESWGTAEKKWQNETKKKVSPLPSGFKDEYGIAVVMYTNDKIHLDFNLAVRTNGTSVEYYKNNFRYKAFHFYLTRALQLLPKVKCTMQLFRGSKEEFYHRGMGPMRLGRFGSTSKNRSMRKMPLAVQIGERDDMDPNSFLLILRMCRGGTFSLQKAGACFLSAVLAAVYSLPTSNPEPEVLAGREPEKQVTTKVGDGAASRGHELCPLGPDLLANTSDEKDATCSSDGKNATWSSDEKDALCSAEHPA